MMMQESLRESVEKAVHEVCGKKPDADFSLEFPEDPAHGEYATNAALMYAKTLGMQPRELAEKFAVHIRAHMPHGVERIEVAGPGFINFHLSHEALSHVLQQIVTEGGRFGSNQLFAGKKIAIEYTDPNPFKEFHIGHFMSNTIGESLARIVEFSGAEIRRANYQGDVGMHVAKAVWGMKVARDTGELAHIRNENNLAKAEFMGKAYAYGAGLYEEDEKVKEEIKAINKEIFEKSDPEIISIYEEGKKWSLEYFETVYARLGTKFDHYFFESETARKGKELVEDGLAKGIFEPSDGAVVFRGDREGLHTRVFINSEGLPTYEAKELGLAFLKHEWWPFDLTYVLTGNEIAEYFKVVLAAMKKMLPEIAPKIIHVPHGMLRLASGKMSSRTGSVITAMQLLEEVTKALGPKMKERHMSGEDEARTKDAVAVGAVKYSILRQSTGKDIIFDFNASLSFEGDSGPYIQYAHARACSVLVKAIKAGIHPSLHNAEVGSPPTATCGDPTSAFRVERLLMQFPEFVLRAAREREPHHIAGYLITLAQAYNSFYAHERILDAGEEAPYRVALTHAVAASIKNGLDLLGIEAPERM